MTDVAGQRVDRSLVGIEGQRRERPNGVLNPELRPEPDGQCLRPRQPAVRTWPAVRREQSGRTDGGLVRIALHLHQGDRAGGPMPVVEPHGVRGVLPALVGQAPAAGVDVLRNPSPSASPSPASHSIARSRWGGSRSTRSSGRPQHQASCSSPTHSGVASTVPK